MKKNTNKKKHTLHDKESQTGRERYKNKSMKKDPRTVSILFHMIVYPQLSLII